MATRSSAGLFTNVPSTVRIGAAAGVAAVAVLVGLVLAAQVAYAGRIYPGVSTMGVDLGGRSPEEARALVEARFAQYAQTPLTIRYESREWQVTPASLGLSLDAAETVRASYLVGRQGSLAARLLAQAAGIVSGSRVSPALAFDEKQASETLTKLGGEFERPPANASLEIGADGSVKVTPSQTGLGLDVAKAVATTQANLLALSSEQVELPVKELPVTLTEEQLSRAGERARKIVGQPLVLTAGDKRWTLSTAEISRLLSVVDRGGPVDVQVDEAGLTAHLERLDREFSRPATDSRLEITGAGASIVPGEDGLALDIESSRTMILAQIGESSSISLVVKKVGGLQPEELADLKAEVDALLESPPTFTLEDRSWPLSADDLAELLVVKPGAPGAVPTLEVDVEALTARVEGIAKRANRAPQDARFRLQGNQAVVLSESVDGVSVDVEATVAAARDALLEPGAAIPVKAEIVPAKINSSVAGEVVVRDLIMESSTSYAGAIPEKVHNIQLAASRLNGTAVPPGAVFSFNHSLGPATLASGFKLGYGIAVNSAGQMETVPSEAGGICQVATTLFHSVFWAGYPIEERNWHLYWIAKYGAPPRGLKGLDATVDDAYGVDFKFRNNTPNWLVVEASASGNTLRFALKGIKPDWKVEVGQPVITNVVRADRTLVRQPDPTMPVGWSLYVEAPEDGFDVAIKRKVTAGDEVIDEWTAKAHYRPSRNVMLYGTKPVAPKPAATPTPAPSATPEATPEATPQAAPEATPEAAPEATPEGASAPEGTPTAAPAP